MWAMFRSEKAVKERGSDKAMLSEGEAGIGQYLVKKRLK